MLNHDVISAFVDNEPFDANALGHALAEPGGRELLLDVIALRAIVQDDAAITSAPDARVIRRQRHLWLAAGFAAATLIFTLGSVFAVKALRPATSSTLSEADVPPPPDHVVTFEPGLDWHEDNR